MALNQDETAEQEEPYEPTASDLALFASLRVTEVAGAILQARIDSEITLETYNKLYEVARKAQIAVETLNRRLEQDRIALRREGENDALEDCADR